MLCLDFANSVDWDAEDVAIRDEVLSEPLALARWGRRLELYPPAGELPAITRVELERALELRNALHHLFRAVAGGREVPGGLLDVVARSHAEGVAAGSLRGEGGAYRVTWADDDPRVVRFAVAADAVALLAEPERLARVRICPGHICGWLFYDASGRRRWCSMATCGSRAKMKRLYERQRGAASQGE